MSLFETAKFKPLVDAATGRLRATLRQEKSDQRTYQHFHVEGKGTIRKLVARVTGFPAFDELLMTTPNFSDVMSIPKNLTAYSGMTGLNIHMHYGRQWMFSPGPLVFPIRIGKLWYGIGLGAAPGKNQYSGWVYRPNNVTGQVDLEIHYDGYYTPSGAGPTCTLMFLEKGYATAQQVIQAYCDDLRDLGWAPKPKRNNPDWWRDTFLFPWGEQCNTVGGITNRITDERESAYESQANQMRWANHLLSKKIPIGVICTSDKWQLTRQRLTPNPAKYEDFRGFADWNHKAGRKAMIWLGLYAHDHAPADWCLRTPGGEALALDPQAPGYRKQLIKDIEYLFSPKGYDYDGFFLDFTGDLPARENLAKAGGKWGLELLHDYIQVIHDAAKNAKKDAMIMTHCAHPYFADVTDVFRLNDWNYITPNVVEQARYRHMIATACSDWLINADNWPMFDVSQWRAYLPVQPELGIPATWFVHGVCGEGDHQYHAFNDDDYALWKQVWTAYRKKAGLK